MGNFKQILNILFLLIISANELFSQSIYTNDMDYVIGDVKQAFIQNRVKTVTHADNLLKALTTMKFNGIRIPIFPRNATTGVDVNPDKEVMDYFYNQALEKGFLIFANPAQGGGGARIANNSLSNGGGVNGKQSATDELVDRIIEFSNEYPNCKWLNPFNEDGRATNSTWSINQIHEVYQRLITHGVNGAELIGPCTWGLPAAIDMFENTNIENYITVATSHNLGHNDNLWKEFIALAKAKNLPVWDSEANNDPGNTSVNKFDAAIANNVDGLVVYNVGNNVDLNTGGFNSTNLFYMSRYLKQKTNIATEGIASQSLTTSTTVNLEPSRAIDNNIAGEWNMGNPSISHTVGTNPWWQVDLGSDKQIDEINIYNRAENRQTLSNFTVSVTNSNGMLVFSKTYSEYPDPLIVINTPNISGKKIKIQLNNVGTLSIAEVKIFAPDESLSSEIKNKIELSISPNPVKDILTINAPNNELKKMSIYNVNGTIIATETTSNQTLKINTSKYAKGIYILKLEGEKFSGTHKIIKK